MPVVPTGTPIADAASRQSSSFALIGGAVLLLIAGVAAVLVHLRRRAQGPAGVPEEQQ
jgi:hypothetical protein